MCNFFRKNDRERKTIRGLFVISVLVLSMIFISFNSYAKSIREPKSPLITNLSLSDKPLLNKSVILTFTFKQREKSEISNYSASARIELPDGFELISGNLEWNGYISDREEKIEVTIKATKVMDYKKLRVVVSGENIGVTWYDIYVDVYKDYAEVSRGYRLYPSYSSNTGLPDLIIDGISYSKSGGHSGYATPGSYSVTLRIKNIGRDLVVQDSFYIGYSSISLLSVFNYYQQRFPVNNDRKPIYPNEIIEDKVTVHLGSNNLFKVNIGGTKLITEDKDIRGQSIIKPISESNYKNNRYKFKLKK